MGNYHHLIQGNNLVPEASVLIVPTGVLERKFFLVSRMNLAPAIPKVEVIHCMGSYVVALGQPDKLDHADNHSDLWVNKLGTSCH